jgi:hypothetical protein
MARPSAGVAESVWRLRITQDIGEDEDSAINAVAFTRTAYAMRCSELAARVVACRGEAIIVPQSIKPS